MGMTPVTDPELLSQLDAPAPERSLGSEIARQVGLTARAGVRGVTALPAMVGDALGMRSSGAVDRALDAVGLPEPENRTERVAQDVAGSMSGSGGMVKLGSTIAKSGSEIVRRIGEMLATGPGTQIVSSGTGAGAAAETREGGGGPGAQLAAGVGTTLATAAAPSTLASTIRGLFRGGEAGRLKVADNIKTFEDAGAGTPTVGQATEGRFNRAAESGLSKTPGSAGRMATKAELEAAGLGTKVDDMAADLASRTGAAPAGRQIKGGLEGFVQDFSTNSGKLYDALDQHIPLDSRVDVAATRSALENLNADIVGAPNVSELFKNARIKGVQAALKADTETPAGVYQSLPAWQKQLLEQVPEAERSTMLNGLIDGKLPYEALKKLRTLVGNEIADSTIASDVPRSKWKALYGALSQDMGAAATAAGPQAEAAFGRANSFHRAGMQRIEDVLAPILKKGDPEDIFKAAISGTSEGATTVAGVMKSLPEESRKVVAATMLRRLGKATAGKQDDVGEVFSPETFLTNWNKITPDAKRVMFATLPDGMRADLDKIAKVASNLREGSKVFSNPSGTAQAGANFATAGATFISLVTGQWHTAGAIAGSVAAANGGARLMTNPKFVKWLAESTKVPVEMAPAQINNLAQISFQMNGQDRKDVLNFITKARAKPLDVSDLMAEQQDESEWGKRQDGTAKGRGFLGVLNRPDGGVSSELTVGVKLGDKEIDVPSMVPTLTRREVESLLKLPDGEPVPDAIVRKAQAFAESRIKKGKSVFAEPDESPAYAKKAARGSK